MTMAITGLASCSEDISATESPGSENLTVTLKNEQQSALINFKKAYIAMLHERSSEPKDAEIPLINNENKHLIIDASKTLLLVTGNQDDLKNADIAIIEKAMDVYGEKNALLIPN